MQLRMHVCSVNTRFLLTFIFVFLLAQSQPLSAQPTCQIEKVTDWASNTFGLAYHKPPALDWSRIDIQTVAPYFNGQVRLRNAVLTGDWPAAQKFWDDLSSIADTSERMRQLRALHFAMAGKGMYFQPSAQAWLKDQPNSLAAQTFFALTASNAATQARGALFSSQTPRSSFALFTHRFNLIKPTLEQLAKRDDIYGWSANISLITPRMYMGQADSAWINMETLIKAAPAYGFSYYWAADYLSSRWSSEKETPKRALKLRNLAKEMRLSALDSLVLEQSIAHVMTGLDQPKNPQQMRAYWSNRFEKAPHLYNLLEFLVYENSMQNWPVVEELATRAIAQNPFQTYSYYARANARKQMAQTSLLMPDLIAAAVLGHNEAMEDIIQGHLRGTLGFKAGNHDQMLAFCKLGVNFGLASAANCIASSYSEGFAGVRKDPRLSTAWHMLGARGGHANSQHDFATLLPQVIPATKDNFVSETSQHWMRLAARQGHVYATNKATPEPEIQIDTACASQHAFEAAKDKAKKALGM